MHSLDSREIKSAKAEKNLHIISTFITVFFFFLNHKFYSDCNEFLQVF